MSSFPQTSARRSDGPDVRLNDKATPSPVTPAVTGIIYPSPTERTEIVDRKRYPVNEDNDPPSVHDHSDSPPNHTLDEVWRTIQHEKALKVAKDRPKIRSLEGAAYDPEQLHIEVPLIQSHESPPRPSTLTKQKSITSFRESTDGRSIVATFILPQGLSKQDVHVSFRRDRLIIMWETAENTEWEEEGELVRERLIRTFHRTLPLPEGTKFDEVYCSMNGRRLSLRYPNMRCIRVDTGKL